MFYSREKSISRKTSGTFHREISVSCTTKECDNVATPFLFYLSSGLFTRRLKKEIFKLIALNVVAVAYERWSKSEVPNQYSDLIEKLLVFWKTGR